MDKTKHRCTGAIVAEWYVYLRLLGVGSSPTVSDEPKELQEIEEALLKHIDLDPVAALGVLCDNCMLDPDVSRDEQMDKTRLRKLVLLFMSNTAKNQIFRHFVTDNVAEKVYREGLLKVCFAVTKSW